MKKWTEYLSNDVYNRLCNCTTIKSDVQPLVDARWLSYKEQEKDKSGFTKEDALVSILELLDCNSRYFGLSKDEYDSLKK